MKPSGIGGQAVIEGVMMKNKSEYAVAVRKPDNDIEVKKDVYIGLGDRTGFFRLPILRGVAAFIDSLKLGMQALTFSSSFYEEEAENEQAKTEKSEKKEAIVMGITMVVSIVVAVGIFILAPFLLAELLKGRIDSYAIRSIIEGVIRMLLFILYIKAITLVKDIRRVFMYHGAEHKVINCIEKRRELTLDNVRSQSKEHKRCGTSFLLYVVIISIIFFVFVQVETVWLRMLLRIVLVPVVAGVAYEFIRLAGRTENKVMNILSKPGLWLQGLTTLEPEDDMIEVAIASVEAVFDWKSYQEGTKRMRSRVHARMDDHDSEEGYVHAAETYAASFEEVPVVDDEDRSEERRVGKEC